MSQESSSAPPTVTPIAIEQSYLEGRGLTRVDHQSSMAKELRERMTIPRNPISMIFISGKFWLLSTRLGQARSTLMAPFMTNSFKFWKGVSYSPRMAGTCRVQAGRFFSGTPGL